MSMWFEQMMQKGAIVTGPALMEKAQQFAVDLDVPDFKPNPAPPNGSYVKVKGVKTPKDRITLVFICNAIGSDKFAYSIGKPRRFRGRTVPISYTFNKKAWTTSSIWCKIIKELDDKLKKRKKLLLIDNASCHKLEFTPKSGIGMYHKHNSSIRSRKCLIREQLLAIERDYMEKFLRSISILRALYIIKRCWWLATPQTIQNCFKKAGIFKDDESKEPDITENILDDEYSTFFEEMSDLEKHDCFGTLNETEI
ncbi:tigger transposable element-derived protein 4-like, partial [Musca vetustissima]|uniref:tigger transposable element-derived protein 4-like n=1 Tax=Musca vetustissima TaxID=27455 RepID=UPI002AB742A5